MTNDLRKRARYEKTSCGETNYSPFPPVWERVLAERCRELTAHLRARRCLPEGRTLSGTSIGPTLAGLGEILKAQSGEQRCERSGWLSEGFLVSLRELPALLVRAKQPCSF